MTYRVGLTGGIGSGKSTVADAFAQLGVPISDADTLSHALPAPGGEALPAIREVFGKAVFASPHCLDRTRLREQVFQDPQARQRLEGILHPMIRARMLAEADAAVGPYSLLVVPLLLETGQQTLVNRVLVVDLPEQVQLARVQARNGLSADEVRRIMTSQASRAQRLLAADDVIDNSGSPQCLIARVATLHRRYLAIAGN